jgi:hypothetical protein
VTALKTGGRAAASYSDGAYTTINDPNPGAGGTFAEQAA